MINTESLDVSVSQLHVEDSWNGVASDGDVNMTEMAPFQGRTRGASDTVRQVLRRRNAYTGCTLRISAELDRRSALFNPAQALSETATVEVHH